MLFQCKECVIPKRQLIRRSPAGKANLPLAGVKKLDRVRVCIGELDKLAAACRSASGYYAGKL